MSFTPNPVLVPDGDRLPLKKRDQRPRLQEQQCDAATFKAPYPYKSHSEFKTKHTSPFLPVPRRVPELYQPWMQTHSSTRSKPHQLSAFRDHHGWAEWRDFSPLHPGWGFSHHYQHHSDAPGTHALQLGRPHLPSGFSPVSLVTEAFHRAGGGYGWEQTLKDRSLNADRQSNGRNKGPYGRRRERHFEHFPRVEKASPPPVNARLPHSPHEDLRLQCDASHSSPREVRPPTYGHSFARVSPDSHSSNAQTSTEQDASTSRALPSSEPVASSSSSSPNHFPWLLPHFLAGSLIELRDGQLRRVEHLQTEDFLLGSLACPDLRLSCCTVQSISPSASSSSISRLLILLHDQLSQELVDVYVEYPFFVRGRGWSSCSPQRTARLCGLHCRQLSVGDICLALTPISAPPPPTLEANTSPVKLKVGCVPLKAPQPQVPPGPELGARGQKKEAEAVRRRHYSAP